MYRLLALLVLLAGCSTEVPVAGVAADAASVTVLGRGIGDVVYSGVSGRDCSVVRLEQGKTYCKPVEPPPEQPPLCTRSLGVVDCWQNPQDLNGPAPHGVADGPTRLTPEQEHDRTARWPKLF